MQGSERLTWGRKAAVAVCLASALLSAVFGLRTYGSFLLLHSAYTAGAPRTSSIRPWMTLQYVAGAYRILASNLINQLGLPAGTDPTTSLKVAADRVGVSPYQLTQRVQRVVAESSAKTNDNSKTGGWLEEMSEQVLTALLVYGYPALALTLLLGAIGLPLPDGIATTVAGSLAAQGRMDWLWAGTITVVASVIGDAIGYGLGRLLNREVLERHGHWFGYTPARHGRVQALFDQWGGLAILITRTIMSYLSSVASLLAGISKYRLSRFLAIALLGRLIWTTGYLGLGYVIGADWKASTSFLANLSGLIVCLALFLGSGSIVYRLKACASR